MCSELTKLEKKLIEIKKQKEVALNYLEEINKNEKDISSKLAATKPVHITEHALLRYIERVYGVPLADVRKELASKLDTVPAFIKQEKNIKYEHNGIHGVFKNKENGCVLVTILDSKAEGK